MGWVSNFEVVVDFINCAGEDEKMNISLDHRDEIVKRLTQDLVEEMEKNGVTEADLPKIADFILEKVDKAQNHNELITLLDQLSAKWPFFETVEQLERGEVRELMEDSAEKDLLKLARAGR
ncbi:MAG TPA: hypothetical protein VLE91_00645 [Candidatus Saccharimonadales bacterium]|nr:hypothetical protein [Candidatus Saccharimonadales bacterium]